MIEIKRKILKSGARNRPSTRSNSGIYGHVNENRYICIHNTGNRSKTATAAGHANWMYNNSEMLVGYHFTVDDREVWQHIPIDEGAWHAGDGARGKGNLHSIGIEICENMVDHDYNKYKQAELNAAWLTARLLEETGLTIKDVKQHFDFSGKNCPSVIRGRRNGWQEFIGKVEGYLTDKPETKPQEIPKIQRTVGVEVDGQMANMTGYLINNRTYLPMLEVARLTGVEVTGHGDHVKVRRPRR